MPDEHQLDLAQVRPLLIKVPHHPVPVRNEPLVTRPQNLTVVPTPPERPAVPRSQRMLDGDALWELVEFQRRLMTRPGISDQLRSTLEDAAARNELQAQLRVPRPQRPHRLSDRRAG